MGLPLSRFRMLSRLCSGGEDVRERLSSYKLVCVVLHDPDDRPFVARMRRRFMDLYERTGKDLLFITFIDPPEEWADLRGLGITATESRLLSAEPGFDGWLMVRHFLPCVAPDATLPSLLVTHDLMSREYVLIDSSADLFEEQLTQLGQFCSQTGGRFSVWDGRFLSFASTLGPVLQSELPDRPLAVALSDVLALQDVAEGDPEAERWTECRIREWKAGGAEAAADCSRYEAAVEIGKRRRERLVERLPNSDKSIRDLGRTIIHMARSAGPREKTLHASFLIESKSIRNYGLCNARSRSNILQYNELLEFFVPKRTRDESRAAFKDKNRSERRNFKQLAQPLAEFFELEVNLTMVQLMRQYSGIEMPEYYRKFKRNCYVSVRTPKESVPLNACEYPDRLKPVMIGKAYYAYRTMCDGAGPYRMPERIGGRFLEDWSRMADMRNDIDHADFYEEDFFGFDEFRQFHAVFSSILSDSLWKMEAIGDALRRGDELPEFDAD